MKKTAKNTGNPPENAPVFSSDLACERRRADTSVDGVERVVASLGDFSWERIRITTEAGAASIGRPIGRYDTLTTARLDLLEDEEKNDAAEEIAKELSAILRKAGFSSEKILVVGLGNAALTPDSIGPKTAERVRATRHIKSFSKTMFDGLRCSEISVIAPGVTASSGIETFDRVMCACEIVRPDCVIAVDSLASRSAERLGRTLQISDTGIFPGSGVGNHRSPLTKESLGTPVVAVGVPTVIRSGVFLSEAGCTGGEDDGMFVSPREIDGITNAAAEVVAEGINRAFGF